MTSFAFPPNEARSLNSFYEPRDGVRWATGCVHAMDDLAPRLDRRQAAR